MGKSQEREKRKRKDNFSREERGEAGTQSPGVRVRRERTSLLPYDRWES